MWCWIGGHVQVNLIKNPKHRISATVCQAIDLLSSNLSGLCPQHPIPSCPSLLTAIVRLPCLLSPSSIHPSIRHASSLSSFSNVTSKESEAVTAYLSTTIKRRLHTTQVVHHTADKAPGPSQSKHLCSRCCNPPSDLASAASRTSKKCPQFNSSPRRVSPARKPKSKKTTKSGAFRRAAGGAKSAIESTSVTDSPEHITLKSKLPEYQTVPTKDIWSYKSSTWLPSPPPPKPHLRR